MNQNCLNLNHVKRKLPEFTYEEQKDTNVICKSIAFFDDIENHIIQILLNEKMKCKNDQECDFGIVGCIAWFTSNTILQFLIQQKMKCHIIVQNESFLHKESVSKRNFKKISFANRIEKLYLQLLPISFRSVNAIDFLGNKSRSKKNRAILHHKFIICVQIVNQSIVPQSLLNGSYNYSQQATNNLENIIFTTETNITNQFFNEYINISTLAQLKSSELKSLVKK